MRDTPIITHIEAKHTREDFIMYNETNEWFDVAFDLYDDDGDCINDNDPSEKVEGLDY